MGSKHERMFEELTTKERKIIEEIRSPNDIKTLKVIDVWEDDHLNCVGIEINGVRVGLWWVGVEIVGACKYWKDERAKRDIIECLKLQMEDV